MERLRLILALSVVLLSPFYGAEAVLVAEEMPGLPPRSVEDIDMASAVQAAKDAGEWKKLKCTPNGKAICRGADRCERAEPTIQLLLDKGRSEIQRCDVKGCDPYPADFKISGAFTNVQTHEPLGLLIKVYGKSTYIEVATQHLEVHLSSGVCVEDL